MIDASDAGTASEKVEEPPDDVDEELLDRLWANADNLEDLFDDDGGAPIEDEEEED